LLSGNHAEIAKWRTEQARLRTAQKRPDLLKNIGAGEKLPPKTEDL
jgi:tRNA (guanine37-N1)-methyltransferase